MYNSEFFKFNYHIYGEFRKFGSVLMKYLKRSDILQIGCGSSCLADSLYDNGFKNIVSMDIVRSVIRKQIYHNRKRRPELTFNSGDATKLEYADESFSAVLDKGTLDAIMSWKTGKCLDIANAMFAEVDRLHHTNNAAHETTYSSGRSLFVAEFIPSSLLPTLLYFSEASPTLSRSPHEPYASQHVELPVVMHILFLVTLFTSGETSPSIFNASYKELQ
ncbi:Methyltransferase-like protein 13 [Trichinella murrelli]|uniref:Methyltransferase-like protein 13 n=1 Tax=Trichinella murrelli TaxID=144512 RepID=A0A0V0TGR0_9BILA|nr:Methyltransferase-like protein 13 [Trichinella murrelli]